MQLGRIWAAKHGDIVRRAQLDNSLRLAKLAALGSVINGCVASATMWSSGWHKAVAAWLMVIVTVAGARVMHCQKALSEDGAALVLNRDERIVRLLALTNGIAWGTGIILAAVIASPTQFNLLAMLIGGMLGAATITYGPLPRAAYCFGAPVMVGSVGAWMVSPHVATFAGILLILFYCTVLVRAMRSNEQLFISKIGNQEALRESSDTVRLLLNDYEEQSSDWLWEIDANGVVIDPSHRFTQACGVNPGQMVDAKFVEIFSLSPERAALEDYIWSAQDFRGLTLKLEIDDSPRWWTLSARAHENGGMRGVASDVTAHKLAEQRISYMAHYDGLTDLANRVLFNETLHRALRRLTDGQRSAVLCLDLDQFKSVNDTLGHPIGDKLLCDVAKRITQATRQEDLVARLGGDEFAVLLHKIPNDRDVEQCAQRIINAIERPFVIEGMQVMTSASIGIAVVGRGEVDAPEMMKQADLALYSAKLNGRNRYAFFEPGMDDAARERRELEMELRAALAKDEFELHYQPLINLSSGQTVSYEALVRWNHPRRGVIMPAAFIPIAEETGLIVQIGEWVIRHATREVANWPGHLRVSVNLSPAQMRSANLVPTIISAVAHAGIEPQQLELEITESVLMQDSETNIAILHKLRDFGVRISLDDFGTGYSSLNYLRSFPFDKIKIDRCFIEDIGAREDCLAIVRAVTSLANSLGITSTAEGVENTAQLDLLRAEGCTEVQGFLISRPTPAQHLADLHQFQVATAELPGIVEALSLVKCDANQPADRLSAAGGR